MCGIISFLLSVSLTVLCLLCAVRVTVLNPKYTVKEIRKSNYAEKLHSELKDQFVSYGSACNINSSFFDPIFRDVITPKHIDSYTEKSIIQLYNNDKSEISTKDIEDKLLAELKKYAEENGFTLDDELNKNIENISEELGDLYSAFVGTFSSSYFVGASRMLARYMPLFKWAVIGLSVFSLLAVIVIRLFFAKAKNYMRYYIYAAAGSTLMLTVAPATALIMKIGSKINVMNPSLYGFASAFINHAFIAALVAAAIMCVITAVLAVIRFLLIKREQKQNAAI